MGSMRTTTSILGLIDYTQPPPGNDEASPTQLQHSNPEREVPENAGAQGQGGRLDPATAESPSLPTVASIAKREVATQPLDLFPPEDL